MGPGISEKDLAFSYPSGLDFLVKVPPDWSEEVDCTQAELTFRVINLLTNLISYLLHASSLLKSCHDYHELSVEMYIIQLSIRIS